MMKAKKIVCPVDFTDASAAALDVASKLARANRAKMYIVHVEENAALVHPGLFGGLPPVTWPTRQQLNATLPTATEVLFEHDLLFGDPATRIVEFAKLKDADLIVMGTHGATGMERLLMGSVAEGVVRRSPVPVLTLKQRVNSMSATRKQPLVECADKAHAPGPTTRPQAMARQS